MSGVIKFSEERLMKVLQAPVISEKATMVAEENQQIVFRVLPDATKPEIKAAVELLFKVEVLSVQTANRQGKQKRSGRFNGRRNHTKRAFVCLKPGQEINFVEEAK
ncbi:MAG: 50S ribosomal protein L23 [Pseudomonadota bacterium]